MHLLHGLSLVVTFASASVVACGGERAASLESEQTAAATPERTATVRASAYNSTVEQTDANPNEGAWGDALRPGIQAIAVSPDLVELGLGRGTEVEIEGLPGPWTVLDRTASRHRNRIDIYMGEDVESAREWGIREVVIRWSDPDPD